MTDENSNLQNWKRNALKELKKKDIDGIFIETPEGINIKPLYTSGGGHAGQHGVAARGALLSTAATTSGGRLAAALIFPCGSASAVAEAACAIVSRGGVSFGTPRQKE